MLSWAEALEWVKQLNRRETFQTSRLHAMQSGCLHFRTLRLKVLADLDMTSWRRLHWLRTASTTLDAPLLRREVPSRGCPSFVVRLFVLSAASLNVARCLVSIVNLRFTVLCSRLWRWCGTVNNRASPSIEWLKKYIDFWKYITHDFLHHSVWFFKARSIRYWVEKDIGIYFSIDISRMCIFLINDQSSYFWNSIY